MRSDGQAVVVRGVTKTYRIGVGRARIREAMPPPLDRVVARAVPRWWRRDTFDALSNVSLSLRRGSSLALVGHNGAGKTTMLKVIAGVTAASRGSIQVRGRVAALIDVLVGFHPDLTGRENVYLLGAIQRYGRREMSERLDRIMDFAEISDLADTPLKRYSAGMISRVAFATIASLDVDVLLLDEVLAVGDAAFQRKCVRWLEDYRAAGGSLIFVSHNLSLVRSMTERAVWIDHGRAVQEGTTPDILAAYAASMDRRDEDAAPTARRGVMRALASRGLHRWGAGGAQVVGVKVGEPNGRGLEVGVSYGSTELSEGVVCLGFVDEAGNEIAGTRSPRIRFDPGGGTVNCLLDPPFRRGLFFPVVAIVSTDGVVRDRWQLDRPIVFEEETEDDLIAGIGAVSIESEWMSLDGGSDA